MKIHARSLEYFIHLISVVIIGQVKRHALFPLTYAGSWETGGVSYLNEGIVFNPSNAETTYAQCTKHKDAKTIKKHLNPVMLVFIRKLSLSTLIRVHMG